VRPPVQRGAWWPLRTSAEVCATRAGGPRGVSTDAGACALGTALVLLFFFSLVLCSMKICDVYKLNICVEIDVEEIEYV
jgi:hypothetical protein